MLEVLYQRRPFTYRAKRWVQFAVRIILIGGRVRRDAVAFEHFHLFALGRDEALRRAPIAMRHEFLLKRPIKRELSICARATHLNYFYVSNPCRQYGDRKECKRQEAFPNVDDAWTDHGKNYVPKKQRYANLKKTTTKKRFKNSEWGRTKKILTSRYRRKSTMWLKNNICKFCKKTRFSDRRFSTCNKKDVKMLLTANLGARNRHNTNRRNHE